MRFYQGDTLAQMLEVLLSMFDLEAKLSQPIKSNTAVMEIILLIFIFIC
jgi:hypothetical protein